eukprot:jgi/Tetstr1/456339/TSEL_043075.t1
MTAARPAARLRAAVLLAACLLAVATAQEPHPHPNPQRRRIVVPRLRSRGSLFKTAAVPAAAEGGGGPRGHVIVSLQKAEAEFVVEWLNYHLWLGFDHVFIYYQDADHAGMRRQLARFVASGVLTLAPWNVPGDQQGAFKHFMHTRGPLVESLLFLDADEFVVLCRHGSVAALYAELGFAGAGGKLCLALPWLHFGTSDLPTHPARTPVMTQYFKRSATVETKMFGKVAVAGGGMTVGNPVQHFWHHCFSHGFQLAREQGVLGDPAVVRLHHYRMRYGDQALARRAARGAEGDFGGQRGFSSAPLSKYAVFNAVPDATLLGILGFVPDLMEPTPTHFRKEGLGEGEFRCADIGPS